MYFVRSLRTVKSPAELETALSMVVLQSSYFDAYHKLVHVLLAEVLAIFNYEFVKVPAAPWLEITKLM
jgi:hypothetical protein